MAASRTSIVTVTYNSTAVLPAMLASVPPGVPIVVVDNASADDSAAVAKRNGADVVRLADNEGFGRACNAGARRCGTEFILFLNPDARLSPTALAALETAADAHPDCPAFNPRIETATGKVRFKGRSLLVSRDRWIGRKVPEDVAELPMLIGGAFFCRLHSFNAIGGFDPLIFLYHEDEDLSVRLAKRFAPVRFASNARVVHDAGHSSGRSPAVARLKGYHMARSRIYVLRKHGRVTPWLRTIGPAIGGMLLPHNFLSARRRAKFAGQIAGALSAFRDNEASRSRTDAR